MGHTHCISQEYPLPREMAAARLKQDVLAVDGIIRDFARDFPNDVPNTPSCRFPELPASQVDVQECISSSKTSLTELLHDRLLFLLQCLLSHLSSRRGPSAARAPPLSTGTVCRKLAALLLEEGEADPGRLATAVAQDNCPKAQLVGGVSTTRTTGTQSTETCLSLCAHCLEHRETLTAAAELMAGALAAYLQGDEELPVTREGGGRVEADEGTADWLHVFEGGVSRMVSAYQGALGQVVSLASRLQLAEEQLRQGKDALSDAQQELVCAVESSEAAAQEHLREVEDRFLQEVQARQGEVARLEQARVDLEGQTAKLRQSMMEAESTIAEQIGEVERLQHSLSAVQHDNTSLRAAANDNSAALSDLREQLADKAEQIVQLEERLLDRERQVAALTHRSKTLQCKHSELVACLGEVETEREAISLSLEQCQEECNATAKLVREQAREIEILSQKLKAKEEELQNGAVAMETQYSELTECRQVCSDLESKLTASAAALSEEQARCQLLMDYPSLSQSHDAAALSSVEARQHMRANTVRIMLLEEQNGCLRSRMVMATDGEEPRSVGKSPSRLWQPSLLQGAYRLQCSSEPSLHATSQHTKMGQHKYKGHLGHLVEALRSASQLSEGNPVDSRSRRNAWS